jgi:predicted RNase H-like nuclease (RuvC/YqgF family)
MTAEEIRQYQREMQQRAEQVQNLREQFRDLGRPVEDLEAVMQNLDRLQDGDIFTDPRELALIHEDMLDRLKRIEFGLRREVEGETDRRATLTGSDDVPDGYRSLVEEYYRSLARTQAPAAN